MAHNGTYHMMGAKIANSTAKQKRARSSNDVKMFSSNIFCLNFTYALKLRVCCKRFNIPTWGWHSIFCNNKTDILFHRWMLTHSSSVLVGVYPYISYQRFDSFFFFIRIKRKEQTHYASTQSDTGWLMDDDISLSSEAKQDPQCVGSSRTAHLSYVDVELLYSTTSVVKSRLKINHSGAR